MVASHMEIMNMILKGYGNRGIYSKPPASLFSFVHQNTIQFLQHYSVRVLFFVQHCSHSSAVQNMYLLRPHGKIIYILVVFQILKNFF